MQVILGAGGVISHYLAHSLKDYSEKIRLVSRNPIQIFGNEELFTADLTDKKSVISALNRARLAYLTVGLPYKADIWQELWPKIMSNVIESCKQNNTKLVFFDNVYAYGNVNGWMTEDTPYNPCSRKGEVRAKIATQLMEETKKGNINAMIARAADFYGPATPLSVFSATIFENLAKGKKAQIMGKPDAKHSLSYTPDCGKATALLGNTDTAYNQIWHLPSDKNVLTLQQMVELAAKYFEVESKYSVISKWMIQLIGIFNKMLKENVEMYYQFDSDYLFDSSKFDSSFKFSKTKHDQGFKETVKYYTNKKVK
jgi:nucleoside-diphosphate-sugar epimerase